MALIVCLIDIFQSTLPQGERPLLVNGIAAVIDISIHAPARGATQWIDGWRETCSISIHAPARGATVICHGGLQDLEISIHAPARGATISALKEIQQYRDFNPRSRKGSDHKSGYI